ncbi:hypothetical protein EZV62_000033 [Acer yangbiense]|uniref:Pectinesterase inhibitor domain-containing protein n=1 Tax=Acer yangbiense TaxID=1000413 RepID=A0A5C7IRK1_9ROSI|nr:hypothetical protein EZV62_000033 [Acer yangbiense]
MVSFKSYYFLQASIVLVLLFMIMHMTPSFARLHVNKVSTKENQLINDICSKTTNPSNCLRLLKSISRTGTVDLKGIAKIILDLPLSNATKTLDLVNSLIPKTNDFRLKEGYLTCSEVYDNAIDEIKNAESDFIQDRSQQKSEQEQVNGGRTARRLHGVGKGLDEVAVGLKDKRQSSSKRPPLRNRNCNQRRGDWVGVDRPSTKRQDGNVCGVGWDRAKAADLGRGRGRTAAARVPFC